MYGAADAEAADAPTTSGCASCENRLRLRTAPLSPMLVALEGALYCPGCPPQFVAGMSSGDGLR